MYRLVIVKVDMKFDFVAHDRRCVASHARTAAFDDGGELFTCTSRLV